MRSLVVAVAVLLALPAAALAHGRDDLASVIRGAPRGVAVTVLDGADHLALTNRTHRTVTVLRAGRDAVIPPGRQITWYDARALRGAAKAHHSRVAGAHPVRDWRIPIRVGQRRRSIRGTLFVVRQRGASAALPIAVGALVVVLMGGAALVVRRARRA